MSSNSNLLLRILEEENLIHKSLISIAKRMNEAIKQNQIELMNHCSAKYDESCSQIEDLEIQRLAVVDNLAIEYMGQKKHLNLNEVVALEKDSSKREILIKTKNELKRLIREFGKLNNSNSILINERIMDADTNFRIIAENRVKPASYEKKGEHTSTNSQIKLINTLA